MRGPDAMVATDADTFWPATSHSTGYRRRAAAWACAEANIAFAPEFEPVRNPPTPPTTVASSRYGRPRLAAAPASVADMPAATISPPRQRNASVVSATLHQRTAAARRAARMTLGDRWSMRPVNTLVAISQVAALVRTSVAASPRWRAEPARREAVSRPSSRP